MIKKNEDTKILVDMLVAYYTMELLKKLNKGGARE